MDKLLSNAHMEELAEDYTTKRNPNIERVKKVAAKCSIVCISAIFIVGSKFGLVIRISKVVTIFSPTISFLET